MDSFIQDVFSFLSRWEFWKWLLSTSITVVSIFGAAYWAQGLFNRNALNREDRDRSLNALIEINEMIRDVQPFALIGGGEIDVVMRKFNDQSARFIHLQSLNEMHKLNINDEIHEFGQGLIAFKNALNTLHDVFGLDDSSEVSREVGETLTEVVTNHILPTMNVVSKAAIKQFDIIKNKN